MWRVLRIRRILESSAPYLLARLPVDVPAVLCLYGGGVNSRRTGHNHVGPVAGPLRRSQERAQERVELGLDFEDCVAPATSILVLIIGCSRYKRGTDEMKWDGGAGMVLREVMR